jgi:hypothetical protein
MLQVHGVVASMYTFPKATGGEITTKPTIRVLETKQGKPVRLLKQGKQPVREADRRAGRGCPKKRMIICNR